MDKMIRTKVQKGKNPETMDESTAHMEHDEEGNLLVHFHYGSEDQTTIAINRDTIFEMFALDGINPSDAYAAYLKASQAEWMPED